MSFETKSIIVILAMILAANVSFLFAVQGVQAFFPEMGSQAEFLIAMLTSFVAIAILMPIGLKWAKTYKVS